MIPTHFHSTFKFASLLLAVVLVRSTSAQPAEVAPINVNSFGPVGLGGDDTAVFQTALTNTAELGQTLEIPASPAPYNIGPLYFPNNSKLILDAGVEVLARTGFSTDQKLLNIVNVSNVRIQGSGAVFRMRKAEYGSGEYRHCLDIEGASFVKVSGISCSDSGGDGVYIGPGAKGYSSDIRITDSTFDNNRRQGLSLISGIRINIGRCNFTNTTGTAPSDGIDIEPNAANNFLQNVSIQDSTTTGNAGNGIAIDVRNLNSSSAVVSVEIERHTSGKNSLSGYYATNENSGYNGATGIILVNNSLSSFDSLYGAVASFYNASGPALSFQNLSVQNPNQARATYGNSAVAVKRGGGGQGVIGNVAFVNTSITDVTGSLDTYFEFVDYSSIGITKVQFVNPGILSGARLGLGVLAGQLVASVNLP
jgi:hypothetical protein